MNVYKCKIYALVSSEDTSKIRYVGKTTQLLHQRLSRHLRESIKYKMKGYKYNWIRKVVVDGSKVEIILIGEVDGDGCKEEIAFIKYGKEEGWKLTNSTNGGEGSLGYKHTPESLLKISLKSKGRIPWSKGKTGVFSQETIEKMKNKVISKETRLKISTSKTGKPSPFKNKTNRYTTEQLEKFRLCQLGRIPWNKEKYGIYSQETLFNMGATNRGKQLSLDHRKKLSLSGMGRIISDETRQKLRLANTGKVRSKEAIEHMKLAQASRIPCNKGIPHTIEDKQKMREAYKNMSREAKQERGQKISLSKKGKKLSLEHRQKISRGFVKRRLLKTILTT